MTDFATRAPSDVDLVAEDHVEEWMTLDPLMATTLGVPGHDEELPDLSPDGYAARAEQNRHTLARLDALDPDRFDEVDRVSVAAMQERLGLDLELAAAGEDERRLDVIASPPQQLRMIFDVMPTDSPAAWARIAARLRAVPEALAGYSTGLLYAAGHDRVAARRQVEQVAEQCAGHADRDGFFATLAREAAIAGHPLPDAVAQDLTRAAGVAADAYGQLATFLRERLLPVAPTADAVGRERYALASRFFLGAAVDLDETYEWGLDELARIEDEMAQVADAIVPGGDLATAVAALDADPARTIVGKEPFRDWMQQLADRTVADLGATHFDIPEPARALDCRIAPTTSGGIYYLAPSDDFARPGSMWWAVPEGIDSFSTWREVTTVFHEGAPGHHLQCAQAVYRRDRLNRWRRSLCWVSGHGEGWALYAERLMAELGFLEDPGARLGMLDGQAFRAARVVVDLGVHLGKPRPDGSGRWDAEYAWHYLRQHVHLEDAMLRFELDRYLGWPGQAPSYKIGERIWLELREQARRRGGSDFDLRRWHRDALDLGSVGLEVLRTALSAMPDAEG